MHQMHRNGFTQQTTHYGSPRYSPPQYQQKTVTKLKVIQIQKCGVCRGRGRLNNFTAGTLNFEGLADLSGNASEASTCENAPDLDVTGTCSGFNNTTLPCGYCNGTGIIDPSKSYKKYYNPQPIDYKSKTPQSENPKQANYQRTSPSPSNRPVTPPVVVKPKVEAFNIIGQKNWLRKAILNPFIFGFLLSGLTRIINPFQIFNKNIGLSDYENKKRVKIFFYLFKVLIYIPFELALLAGIVYVTLAVIYLTIYLAIIASLIILGGSLIALIFSMLFG